MYSGKTISELSIDRLKEVVSYNAETGVFTWLTDSTGPGKGRIERPAGTVRPDGYLKIYIDGKSFLLHRLAWFYVYGEWPKGQIDHENLIHNDNRICNLRDATNGQNKTNTIGNKRKSGIDAPKGVYWHKRDKRWSTTISGKYLASSKTNVDKLSTIFTEEHKKRNGKFSRV